MLFSHILHSNLSLLQAEQTVPQSALYLDPKKFCLSIFFSSQDLPQLSAYASVTAQVKTTGNSHGEMESVSNRNEEALLGKISPKQSCRVTPSSLHLGNLLVCISFLPFAAQDFT